MPPIIHLEQQDFKQILVVIIVKQSYLLKHNINMNWHGQPNFKNIISLLYMTHIDSLQKENQKS